MQHYNYTETMFPNLLSKIGLTASERSLYWAIKECAGENNTCTESQKNLAAMSGLSRRSVQRTLKKLSEVNYVIQKPLIMINHRISELKGQDTNEIIILDIWDENHRLMEV